MTRSVRTLASSLFALSLAFLVAACGSEDGPNTPPDDGRPDGTVRARFVMASNCDLTVGEGIGEVYNDLRVKGGSLIEAQPIVDRELNYFYDPLSGPYELVVLIGQQEVYSTLFYMSDRDVQLDSVVCQQ